MVKVGRLPLAKQGLAFILPAAGVGLFSILLRFWPATIFFGLITAGLTFFFRDPERKVFLSPNHLLAPADGRIIEITKKDESTVKVSIFLSLLDVHLVRSPLEGTIAAIEDKPGESLPAYRREASTRNRSKTLLVQGQQGVIELKMIVGVAARRIFCYVRPGEKVLQAQRVGLMAFGSRVEVSFPSSYALKIRLDQKVKAGITLLAESNPR